MKMENIPIGEDVKTQVKNCIYNPKIFILPPWEEIYKTDQERKQTWEEAVKTFETMKQTYLEFGYHAIEIPKGSVEDRCSCLLSHLQ
ncbi:AAA family ATPase [Rhizosphaericola mali]|uniref:AAA family ATPase n=2 Tax=Rhizosphaericola mali TaxID=2545455 RepID=A0A5P2G563_9BACT|nr:AAA family ATPase [Rhizosphaericola mali]